jgi:hypothetical protein
VPGFSFCDGCGGPTRGTWAGRHSRSNAFSNGIHEVALVARGVATYTRNIDIAGGKSTMRAMQSLRLSMLVVATFPLSGLALASTCPAPNPVEPLRPTLLAPVSSELAAVDSLLGAPNGVLSHNTAANESVDEVLLRILIEGCSQVANATPAPGAVNPNDPAAYKPRTQFDNTPWRFNMSQNGKKMTADEFSAWMKSRGVRVARGAGASVAAPANDAVPPATEPASSTPEPPVKP